MLRYRSNHRTVRSGSACDMRDESNGAEEISTLSVVNCHVHRIGWIDCVRVR